MPVHPASARSIGASGSRPAQRRSIGDTPVKHLRYAIGIAIRPFETISSLVLAPHHFRVRLFGVCTLGILYGATELLYHWRGMPPLAEAFLRIPPEAYYLYEAFFNLPVALAGRLLMGSTIYLIVPRTGISYRDLLGVIGLPYGILVLPLMWVPETILGIAFSLPLGGELLAGAEYRVCRTGTLGVSAGCALAVRKLYALLYGRSLLNTLPGFVVSLFTSVVCIG